MPYNWRPFIPVHLPGSTRAVRLQRAQLPGGGPDPTTGRGEGASGLAFDQVEGALPGRGG